MKDRWTIVGGKIMVRTSTAFGIGLVALVLAATSANAGTADTAGLMGELSSLRVEQGMILQKRDENLALKRQNEAKLTALEPEKNRLKVEAGAIERERPGVERQCTGTVPEREYQAALARCNAVLNPFNARVNRFNADRDRWIANYAAVEKSEQERVASARKLLEAYDRNVERMAQIQRIILASAPGQCVLDRHCGDLAGEAGAACLISCWDGGSGFRSTTAGAPPFAPAPARAAGVDDDISVSLTELKSIGTINPALSQSR